MSPVSKIPLVLASSNAHKREEFQTLFRLFSLDSFFELRSLVDYPLVSIVEETEKDFVSIVEQKTSSYFAQIGVPVISDDSGIVIPSLGGYPGIYSARYAEYRNTTMSALDYVLEEMKDQENRDAFFICALSIRLSKDISFLCTGSVYGWVARKPLGQGGFGYDPIFYLPDLKKTMAQCSFEEKQRLSHRSLAIQAFQRKWNAFLNQNAGGVYEKSDWSR